MKSFNTYFNSNKQGDVLIKLAENAFLYIGREGVFPTEQGTFYPANDSEESSNHFYIVDKSWGRFYRNPKTDGLEFDIPERLHKPIIKRMFLKD